MPWKKVNAMEERGRFVVEVLARLDSFSALCHKYGISRKTGYKWVKRFQEHGSVEERSRAPKTCPHKTPDRIVELLLLVREENPCWGPKKLVRLLYNEHGIDPPSRSTAGDILKKHGLIAESKKKRRQSAGRLRRSELLTPKDVNDVWSVDYKGWFRLGDRSVCHPLTISDMYSRYVLSCQCYPRQSMKMTKEGMSQAFETYGLPQAIRVDNGTPFGSTGLGGFTALSAWWLRLGIIVDFIEPGKPQQNGSHERMHRTLKLEAAMPPERTLAEQQKRLDTWRCRFNEKRPHEALGQVTPLSVYRPSSRRLPLEVPNFSYPSYFEVRQIRWDGMFKWGGNQIFLGQAYVKCRIGLIQNYDGIWLVYVGEHLVGGLLAQEPKHVVPVRKLLG